MRKRADGASGLSIGKTWLVLFSALCLSPVFLAGGDTAGSISSQEIVARMLARNQQQRERLLQYSVARTYQVTNEEGRLRAEAQIQFQYRAPSTKQYTTISENGSRMIGDIVFKPLLDGEVQMSGEHAEGALTPANYDFLLAGEEDMHGRLCYVLELRPKRKEKYLLEGRVWVSADEYAVLRIAGRLAKSPSWWVKNTDFVRQFEKVGEFWLPMHDETVSDIRMFGKNMLTVKYRDYDVVTAETLAQRQAAKSSIRPLPNRPQRASMLE